jgi:hypothetical protein
VKKTFFSLVILSILFIGIGSPLTSQEKPALFKNRIVKAPVFKTQALQEPQASITNGTVPGTNITYSYGSRTFSANGNFTASDTGSIHEEIKEERIEVVDLELINSSSFKIVDIYLEIKERRTTPLRNSSTTFWLDNSTYINKLVDIFTTPALYSLISYIDNISITDAILFTTDEDYLGKFSQNVTWLQYQNNVLNHNVSWHVFPRVYIVSVQKIPARVELNWTLISNTYMSFFSYYSVEYNIEASEWFAQIKDEDRLFLQLSAFNKLTLDYSEVRWSQMSYWMHVMGNVTLKNTTDDSYIPFDMFPFSLRPYFYQQNGSMTDIDIRIINQTAIAASTTALQAFHARISETMNNTQVNASSLVAWMISSTPRLIAYQDGNLDKQLNLDFNPNDGLAPADGDIIPYIGIAEAYGGDVKHYRQLNHTFDQMAIGFSGLELLNHTVKNQTEFEQDYSEYHLGLGSYGTTPTQRPYWNEPDVDNDTGVVTFDFGIGYENFPVTWVNTANGTTHQVPMNITYAYLYVIDPIAGTADLSPTITYGSLDANPALKAAVSRLSLATMYKSDFLSIVGLYAKRQRAAEENVTSSRTGAFATISFSGPGTSFSTVDTRGEKENYTLNGVQHQTNASILNLFGISGKAVVGNVTTFESESENLMGSAYLETTEVAALEFNYRKDLILISYPVWGGEEIIHDPTYSAVYVPSAKAPTITSYPVDSTVEDRTVVVLSWTANDPDADEGTYEVKHQNGTTIASGSWTSGVPVTVSVAAVEGETSYTITFYDSAGNSVSYTVKVTGTVFVGQSPTITSSMPDTTIVTGSTIDLTWTATDIDSDESTYEIKDADGNVLNSGDWTSGTPVIYQITAVEGTTTYTITFYDTAGNDVSTSVTITGTPPVVITDDPAITQSPTDATAENGTIVQLNYIVLDSDSSSGTWELKDQNNVVVDSGSWTNATLFSASVTALEGAMIYTMTVSDSDSNTDTATVTVTGTAPVSSSQPSTTASQQTSQPEETSTTPVSGFTFSILILMSIFISFFVFYKRRRI